MKFYCYVLVASLSLFLVGSIHASSRGDLYGMVVILDPGHGGSDPGSHGTFRRNGNGPAVDVYEDEYVYDIAKRIAWMIKRKNHQGITYLTIRDTKQQGFVAFKSQQVISPDRNEVYVYNGAQVCAGISICLARRTQLAKRELVGHRNKKVVFISLHFDSLGTHNAGLEGMHVIRPRGHNPQIINILVDEMRKAGLIQKRDGVEYNPVYRNGDVRNLFVLRASKNNVRQRVLVEFGNFANERDVWRLRASETRDKYARVVVRALIRLNRLPMSAFR